MQTIPSKVVRQLFIIGLILFLGFLIMNYMLPYLSGVLGALTLFVLLRRWQLFLVKKWKWNASLAAVALMILSFVIILIPISLIVLLLSSKMSKALGNSEAVLTTLKENIQGVESRFHLDLIGSFDVNTITDWLAANIQLFAGSTFDIAISVGIMYFLLYYILTNRRAFKESLLEYIPLSVDNLKILGQESVDLIKSNAIGIPLVAILQGVVALIGFFIFGVDDPFFWFAITAIGSMIPFVGTALGILPVCIMLYISGQHWEAIGLALYGTVVVGGTDNVLRLFIQKKLAQIHPLITLIGVIIGIPIFGFIGLIFGPILVSIFLLILKIYKQEYGSQLKDSASGTNL